VRNIGISHASLLDQPLLENAELLDQQPKPDDGSRALSVVTTSKKMCTRHLPKLIADIDRLEFEDSFAQPDLARCVAESLAGHGVTA
jgi:hypothetical protein